MLVELGTHRRTQSRITHLLRGQLSFDVVEEAAATNDQLHASHLHSEVARLRRPVLVATVMIALLHLLVAGLRALRAADRRGLSEEHGGLDRSLTADNTAAARSSSDVMVQHLSNGHDSTNEPPKWRRRASE